MSDLHKEKCRKCVIHGKRGDYSPRLNSVSIQDYSGSKKTWTKVGYYCRNCGYIVSLKKEKKEKEEEVVQDEPKTIWSKRC